jgi:hypothetical protein
LLREGAAANASIIARPRFTLLDLVVSKPRAKRRFAHWMKAR